MAGTPVDNRVRRAYALYLGQRPTRANWNQVALLFAVRPNAAFWIVRATGYNHIFENGTNQWRDEPDKNQCLVAFAPEARAEMTRIVDEPISRSARNR